ncbi:MAG: threonine--tRNA ligase, partial [Euryarchaeota archaeon]|nr:threonine--tRNA ligase [Euryarchaeota archaeon]
MRILLIHSDYIQFEAKQKTPVAEEVPEEMKKGRIEEVLVVFTAVEEIDEQNPSLVSERAVNEITDVARKVNAQNIFIYPYAHLSSSLSSPSIAVEVLKQMENLLKEKDFNVARAPFGYYKTFEIKCKGHPLSELSRTILP